MMMRTSIISLAIAINLQLAIAQDFQRSYSIAAGGHIAVWNYTGDITVKGYEGNTIIVTAYKKGPDRHLVEIIDKSLGNRIEIFPRYLRFGRGNASVDFELRVPISNEYNFSRLSSFGGKVEVSNVTGKLRAETIKGDIDVKDVNGQISVSSVSGDVRVDISRILQRRNVMILSSISGNIEVRAPSNLEALIKISSSNGLLRSDFPIEIQEMRYGPGKFARGILGSGQRSLSLNIRSVSGQVSLIKK